MLSISTARNSALNEILSYTYPKLHAGTCWFISFYAFDPEKGALRRKRIKINSIGTAVQKRKYAAQVCHRLSAKLEAGWNPWVEADANYSYKLFSDALAHYRNYITKQLNDGVLRQSTIHGYMCSAGIMERWAAEQPSPIRYVYQFDRTFCIRFLDYVYVGRDNSPTTRNNSLAFLRSFSTFLVQHLYIKEKPTEGIQNMSKGQRVKERTVIEAADMRRLHDWLSVNNRSFLLACYFLHYMLIRPREISKLRLSDICVAKQTVYIDAVISKNKKSGFVTIPSSILELMIDLDFFNAPSNYYIFSTGFRPGSKLCSERVFRNFWNNTIVPALKFPKEYKFYSLKDSGITEMLRVLDTLSVKEQARHSSLVITDAYTPQGGRTANPRLQNYKGIL
ncbi:MAG: site-specific integrase [Alistipes sp.]